MRSSEQIERDVERAKQKADPRTEESSVELTCIQIELLRDIRELLIEQNKRADPATYR